MIKGRQQITYTVAKQRNWFQTYLQPYQLCPVHMQNPWKKSNIIK